LPIFYGLVTIVFIRKSTLNILMHSVQKFIVSILVAISIIGIFGIPLGDPKFITEAIALESAFIALTILSIKKPKYALIPNIGIACLVIAGNTISPKHTEIMLSLHPLYNAIILIIGGYILQGLLLAANIIAFKNCKLIVV